MLAGPLHHLQVNQPHPQQSRAALENGTAGELVSVGSPTASAGGKERDFSLVRIRTTCIHSAVRRRLPPASIRQGVVALYHDPSRVLAYRW
jgi:hypothetical protein